MLYGNDNADQHYPRPPLNFLKNSNPSHANFSNLCEANMKIMNTYASFSLLRQIDGAAMERLRLILIHTRIHKRQNYIFFSIFR